MRRAPLYTGRAPPMRASGGGDCGEWNRPGHAERWYWVTGEREPAPRADWPTLLPPSSPSWGAAAAESELSSRACSVSSAASPQPVAHRLTSLQATAPPRPESGWCGTAE